MVGGRGRESNATYSHTCDPRNPKQSATARYISNPLPHAQLENAQNHDDTRRLPRAYPAPATNNKNTVISGSQSICPVYSYLRTPRTERLIGIDCRLPNPDGKPLMNLSMVSARITGDAMKLWTVLCEDGGVCTGWTGMWDTGCGRISYVSL